jgi:hypothetical protein
VALLTMSFPSLTSLAIILSALGLLLGLLGLLRALAINQRLPWPATAGGLSLIVLLLSLFCPTFFGSRPRTASKPRPDPLAGKIVRVNPEPSRGVKGPIAAGDEWTDASCEAVQIDGVRVRLTSVTVRRPVSNRSPSTGPLYLELKLSVQNQAWNRNVQYVRWAAQSLSTGQTAPSLTDDQGRPYRFCSPPSGPPLPAEERRVSLRPLKSCEDKLLFEVPSSQFDSLRLELPAAACGAAGSIRLKIPRSLVIFR